MVSSRCECCGSFLVSFHGDKWDFCPGLCPYSLVAGKVQHLKVKNGIQGRSPRRNVCDVTGLTSPVITSLYVTVCEMRLLSNLPPMVAAHVVMVVAKNGGPQVEVVSPW